MPDEITLTSTTDSEQDIRAALGLPPSDPADTSETTAEATPAPAAEAADDEEAGADDDGESAASDAGRALAHRRLKAQERIKQLVAQKKALTETQALTAKERDDLKAERDRIQAELAALKAKPTVPATPVAEPTAPAAAATAETTEFTTPKPKEDDFEQYGEYIEALTDWKAEKRAHDLRQEFRREREADRQRLAAEAEATALMARVQSRVEIAKTKHPDYDAVMEAGKHVPVSAPMRDHMRASDLGIELAYHFAQHPEEAAQIAALPPGPALVALGRLEARLESESASASAGTGAKPTASARPATPAVSKAPAPMPRVGAQPTVSTVPLDQLDYQAYKRERERRRA